MQWLVMVMSPTLHVSLYQESLTVTGTRRLVGLSINKLGSSGDGYVVPIYDYTTKKVEFHEEVWEDGVGLVKHTDIEYPRDMYLAEYAVRGVVSYV